MITKLGWGRVFEWQTKALAAALCCVSLSACGAAGDGTDDFEQVNADQQALTGVASGFYQVAGGPEVYWLQDSGTICWVRDPGMLMAIRWTTTPQWTSSPRYSSAQLHAQRIDTGACNYPNGKMVRTYDTSWVYRFIGIASFCHVKDMAQLALFGGSSKVLVMQKTREWADYSEGGGVLGDGAFGYGGFRQYTGDCENPGQLDP